MAKMLTKDERNAYVRVMGAEDIRESDNKMSWDFVLDNIPRNVGKSPSRIRDGQLFVQRWLIEKKWTEWNIKWMEEPTSVKSNIKLHVT